ncbi:MAG: outer membrane protein assembly factor BamD [Gammaproteobacteria bacterium]|jgi:outer membrane protein assembly factor BamD|nr:outer membrane protein assembly factor BamD [Gammaproteobacteria bacterium]MBP6053046.1 outer membrane protein assembly factor BamD [Pseudomonadales bacterium]MBK6583559.1 outer membrane protein assembly factor BamD [Gammaproteobacteria bacterium]MBK7521897.1 outer membrane protein assembly factor BamD [Gammaproteobacteria bacterium]MBK7727629.1 outer membrane protein assembly factor BamD [Gammaproteobacteria bacterium]
MSLVRTVSILLLALNLAGCSWLGIGKDDEIPPDQGERQLYEAAQKNIKSSNFELAIKNLQLLEARYPFGPYAEQAQIELIYAHYRNYDHEEAVAAADRFIRLHPQQQNVDYAYYMKGLSAFTEGQGLLERFLPTDMTLRDPGPARQSFADFSQLLSRFPNSDYAADARARMVYLRNLLARYEINVANYYFKRRAYVAALNRGRFVVENFQETPAVPDGLAVMAQAYLILGMNDLADNAVTALRENYPTHPSLDKSGKFIAQSYPGDSDRSWVNILSVGFLDRAEPPSFDNRDILPGQ